MKNLCPDTQATWPEAAAAALPKAARKGKEATPGFQVLSAILRLQGCACWARHPIAFELRVEPDPYET